MTPAIVAVDVFLGRSLRSYSIALLAFPHGPVAASKSSRMFQSWWLRRFACYRPKGGRQLGKTFPELRGSQIFSTAVHH